MTTHYGIKVAKWDDYNVAACQARGFRFPTGATSTDKADVDCTRCAKKFGFEPKAKVESKNPVKTCACCFNDQKVKPNGKMFKHGYERPGYGYILGGCPGDMYAPYQVSVEGTLHMSDLVAAAIDATERSLQALVAAKTIEVPVEVWIPRAERTGKQSYKMVFFTMNEGEAAKAVVDERGVRHWLGNFDDVKAQMVKSTERRIESMKNDLRFFQNKVVEWKPA